MSAGTGLSEHFIDRENKRVAIDFSGKAQNGENFRNDSSILFFCANSYKSAFLCLDNELKSRFENHTVDKDIEHMILPYYFNFRHYVELSLKALIIALTKESPTLTHDLQELMTCIIMGINAIEFDEKTPAIFCTKDKFEKAKHEAIEITNELKIKISEYQELECAVEFYRYIFERENKHLILRHHSIELDYNKIHLLFIETRDLFDKLSVKLRDITYIYSTL